MSVLSSFNVLVAFWWILCLDSFIFDLYGLLLQSQFCASSTMSVNTLQPASNDQHDIQKDTDPFIHLVKHCKDCH